MARTLREIAWEITNDWKVVHYAAKPYLSVMYSLENIDDMYWNDHGKHIVRYFLSNAGNWRGETARRIKKELKEMLGS